MSKIITQNISQAETLLAMKPEELAGYVLEHLHSYGATQRSHNSHPNNLAIDIKGLYPREFQERIEKRIHAVCDWLRVNGYIASISSQGFFDFTEVGEVTDTFEVFFAARHTDAVRAVPMEETKQAVSQVVDIEVGDSDLDIFISHSSKDTEIAVALIDLLRAAIDVPADRIRCTSVPGYKLKGGAPTNEILRREVYGAVVFIGLITEASLHSAYVLFELGARWGANRHLLPVLASETPSSVLRGPLSGINALRLDSQAEVHQVIDDVAGELKKQKSSASVYQKYLDVLIRSQDREAAATAEPARASESLDSDDMGKYRAFCIAVKEAGSDGNVFNVEMGSEEHMWAERMVERGLLRRMVAGRFYALPK